MIGYGLIRSDEEKINSLVHHLYKNILDTYWEPERKYIDENYCSIPFPFVEIPTLELSIICTWTLEHFIGYLHTWSAVQNYMKKNGIDPVEIIYPELQSYWERKTKREFHFPVLLRVGKMD